MIDLVQRRGFSGKWDVALAGVGLAYDGSESAAAVLWSATDRTAALAELQASWVAPPDRLRVEVPASALEALAPGLYLITVILRGEEEAAEGWLHVLPGIES